MPKVYKDPTPIIEELVDDDPYSSLKENKIREEIRDLYFKMLPYEEARNREIIRKIHAGDDSDTPYSTDPEYLDLNKRHGEKVKALNELRKGRYGRIADTLGRKRYENFSPYPNSVPVSEDNPGGSPEITGIDRLYALYQHAVENGHDPYKFLTDDRIYFPNRTPSVLEFENDKFQLNGKGSGGEHWKKKDGKWEHVSTGTKYGEDIFDLLGKENVKNWK